MEHLKTRDKLGGFVAKSLKHDGVADLGGRNFHAVSKTNFI